jgi:hypothetical protein
LNPYLYTIVILGISTSFPVKIVPRFCPAGQCSGLSEFPVEVLLSR